MISLTCGSKACSIFTRAHGLKARGMLFARAWLEGVWHVWHVLLCAWAEGTCGRLSRSRGPKAVVCLQYVACSPQRAARRCVACFPTRGPKECGMLSLARDPEACGMVTPARGPEACDVFSSAMWPEGLRYVSCARDPKARGMLFSQRVVPKCVIGFPGRLA